MNKLFTYSAIFPIILITFISIFFIPAIVAFYKNQGIPVNLKFFTNNSYLVDNSNLEFPQKDYLWPTKNYKTITSSFGYRTAPTTRC